MSLSVAQGCIETKKVPVFAQTFVTKMTNDSK